MTEQDLMSDNDQASIQPYQTTILVLGSGGAGCNTVNHMAKKRASAIETVAINTDAQDLLHTQCDRRILIGKNLTRGLGAGGDPTVGERAVEESRALFTPILERTDMLFLTCGLGGGTGTGSLPVVSQIARDMGILTIAVVTMPFSEEGIIRWQNAQIGLEKLQRSVDSLIILRNDRLSELYPEIPLAKAFLAGDELLTNALIGLSDLVIKEGLINLDFADVSMILRDGPNTLIGVGESNSENRMEEALKRAIKHPMMEADISGAQSALIQITGGKDMTLGQARQILRMMTEKLDPNARIIWGTQIDPNLKSTVRVMLILTGFQNVDFDRNQQDTALQTRKTDTEPGEEFEMAVVEESAPTGQTIFDIKESILASGAKISTQTKPRKPMSQTTQVFYKIFEEEVTGDLKRFDRAIHFLRENPQNRKALLDARQACKLLYASAQMFGFDEIGQLLSSMEEILSSTQSRDIQLTPKIIDSLTLAMEMVVDLVDNRTDGRGETGYIVDRLKELKREQLKSYE